ncbi:DUF2911 domain-containing protein [Psychroserpens sp.]
MKKIYLFLFLSCLIQTVYGQYQIGIIPRVSPDKKVYQKIGYTEIEIQYGSPSINNRQIWGDLVSYGKVWRAGANSATTIEFYSSVKIDGKTLEKGKYSFFLIPKEKEKWTAIFNKVSKQWGAFKYNKKEDALRLEVSPRTTKSKNESLIYTINQTGFKYGSIICSWDLIEIEVSFETNYLTEFEEEIESRASIQPEYIKWIPYLQGAEHLEQINNNIELAKKWIDNAEKIMNLTQDWNDQFYPRQYVEGHLYWVKAKILARDSNYIDAIEYVNKLKSLQLTDFYNKKNEIEEIDLQYKTWKKR